MKTKFSNILTYGFFICIPALLLSVISYVFTLKDSTLFGIFNFVIIFLTILFTQRYYQKNYYKNTANFGILFKDTVFMVIIFAIINGVFTYLLYKVVAPEEIESLLTVSRNQMYSMYNGMLSDSQIEQSIEMSRKFMTPGFLAIFGCFISFLQGILFVLVATFINKKNKNSFEEVMADVDPDETKNSENNNE